MGFGRTLNNARSFVGNCMGGLRGGSSIASWMVAGTLAYVLWIKPDQEARRDQEARALLAANSQRYAEKSRPIPDPQQTGTTYGKGNKSDRGLN